MATVYQKLIESASNTVKRSKMRPKPSIMQLKELSPSKLMASSTPLSKYQYQRLMAETGY